MWTNSLDFAVDLSARWRGATFPPYLLRGLWLASLICRSSAGFVSAAEEPRPLYVEGYAGHVSYAPGEDLTLHVSTSAAAFSVG